ncbi:MAG: glycogen/starch/alpha-glucan phosphorylase, partial [Clostridium perfringens]|nr:glycogen/starch/alpha-glucan phosphorylase [Clostridium perfringens]
MIRTIVCQRDGCNGNAFYINSHDGEMSVVCKECNSEYKYETENNSLLMLSTCSNCNNDTNHTILSEALEIWPINMFKELLPRIYM